MLVLCSKCGTVFDCQEPQCPNCGSKDRTVEVSDSADIYEYCIGIKDKNLYSGRHKYFFEITKRPDFDRDSQQSTMVTRRYNRRKDRDPSEITYIEEIRTKSGELIKINTDKIVDHKGHGCDKKKRRHSGGGDGN